MPIPLGILAAAGFRPSAAGSFDLLETTVLTGSQASVEFTNLTSKYASTYQHLQIRAVVQSQRTSVDAFFVRYNGDSGTNYTFHRLSGNGSSVSSGVGTGENRGYIGDVFGQNSTNQFAPAVIDILDPFETSKYTTGRSLSGYTTGEIRLGSHLWLNTAALTSINLFTLNGNLSQYSRFSLYGLKAA